MTLAAWPLVNAAVHAGWVLGAAITLFIGFAVWTGRGQRKRRPLEPVDREPWTRPERWRP